MKSIFLSFRAACHRLSETAAATAHARSGAHGAQAMALIALGTHDGRSLSELAAATATGQAATTTLVRRMENGGLVTRTPDAEDGRSSRVRLTAAGHAAREAVHDMIAEFNEALEAGFSDAELEVIYRFLAQAERLEAGRAV